LLAAGAVAGLLGAAPPASAAPQITLNCDTGQSMHVCSVSPYIPGATITWTQYNGPMPPWDGLWYVYDLCDAGQVVHVGVTVTDATGSTTQNDRFRCSGDPWP
jgi:hypothetical protein